MDLERQKRTEQNKRIIKFILRLFILICIEAEFTYMWCFFFNPMKPEPFQGKGNWLIEAVYFLLLCVFMRIMEGLKIGTYRNLNVILSQFIAIFLTNACSLILIILIVGNYHLVGRIIGYVLIMYLIQDITSCMITIISGSILSRIFPAKKMVVLYENRKVNRMIEKIHAREDKYVIVGTLMVDRQWRENLKALSGFQAVLLYDISSPMRNDILKYCYQNEIRTYMIPKISDILVQNALEINIFDTPFFLINSNPVSKGEAAAKRVLDLLFSFVGIVITFPIMLITAIVIKLYDHGPILYRQKRCTIGNREFEICKFRSMVVDAEKDGVARLASANDSRVTPIGKFIRKTRIDELPQLINILKGDMSLVGPRPERPEIIAEYTQKFPEFAYRTKVKAGLTGYAQVYGKYNTTSYDKLKWDLMYVQKYSFMLDIQLILMTIKVIFLKESTEGLSEGERIAASDILQDNIDK